MVRIRKPTELTGHPRTPDVVLRPAPAMQPPQETGSIPGGCAAQDMLVRTSADLEEQLTKSGFSKDQASTIAQQILAACLADTNLRGSIEISAGAVVGYIIDRGKEGKTVGVNTALAAFGIQPLPPQRSSTLPPHVVKAHARKYRPK